VTITPVVITNCCE